MAIKNKRAYTLAAVALTALTALTACDADSSDKNKSSSEDHSFSLSGKSITIQTAEAGLRIQTGGQQVKVHRALKGSATDKGHAKVSMDGSTLKLSLVCSGITVSCSATDTVTIPSGVAVHLKASGSPVRIVDVKTDIDADISADGSLTIENPAGRLRLHNPGNSITVTGARSSDVEADAVVDGKVNLAFASAPTRVVATCKDGSVVVSVPKGSETYRLDLSGGRASGGLHSDPKSSRSITVRAGEGSVRVAQA